MNIFTKYSPKRTIFWEEHAPEPPYQTLGCAIQIPALFQKYFEPPRNEILDMPLSIVLIVLLRVIQLRWRAIV